MRERWELRVRREYVAEPELLAGGRMMAFITQLKLNRGDAVLDRLVEQHHERKASGQIGLISQAIVTRRYSAEELRQATLFQLLWTKKFYAVGMETGTIYDRQAGCAVCGAGARQVGPLRLRRSDMPAIHEAASTLSHEYVVSERVAALITSEGLTGVAFRPVDFSSSRRKAGAAWFQLAATGPRLGFVPPAHFADDMLDGGQKHRCPLGDMAGNVLTTEAYVAFPDGPQDDFMESEQYVGWGSGHILPVRMNFVSSRFRETMLRAKVRGWDYEVAHVEVPSYS